jgi:DNA segregation ATPase FtsK/SpoIIIE-like protein
MIIIKRYQEAIARPKAVDDFQKAMSGARMFFIEAKKNQTEAIAKDEPLRHSEEELNDIFERLQENEAWMSDKMKQYKVIEHDLTKDPVFFVKDLNEKGKNLQMAVSLVGPRKNEQQIADQVCAVCDRSFDCKTNESPKPSPRPQVRARQQSPRLPRSQLLRQVM